MYIYITLVWFGFYFFNYSTFSYISNGCSLERLPEGGGARGGSGKGPGERKLNCQCQFRWYIRTNLFSVRKKKSLFFFFSRGRGA